MGTRRETVAKANREPSMKTEFIKRDRSGFMTLEDQRTGYNYHMQNACGVEPGLGLNPQQELLSPLYKGDSLLDAGCGNGGFSYTLLARKHVKFATLLDISDTSIDWAYKTLHFIESVNNIKFDPTPVLVRCALEEFETQEKFDLIGFWEGLEHIIDLDIALSKICLLLKHDGVFVGSVPIGYEFDHESHLHHFDIDSLTSVLERYFDCVFVQPVKESPRFVFHVFGQKHL